MSETRSYYAIIPASVRYDDGICANAKLLYGEITALCSEKGFCWAGNEYFARLYGVTIRTITRWIRELKEGGHIRINYRMDEYGRETQERCISIPTVAEEPDKSAQEAGQKCLEGWTKTSRGLDKNVQGARQKCLGGLDKNVYHNNTINNTVNITVNKYNVHFEKIWNLYPIKKGKGQVSDAQKRKLCQIPLEEMERAIKRYLADLEKDEWRKPQNGSTFFNSGYVDYLDANYQETAAEKAPGKYDFAALEKSALGKVMGGAP